MLSWTEHVSSLVKGQGMNFKDSNEDEEIFDEKVRQFMIREGWDELSRKELEQKVSAALELLMKLGQVEQLVGEDGEFYYRSTKRGRKHGNDKN